MARTYMKTYVPRLPNYTTTSRRSAGRTKTSQNGCSDALVDAIVAWGTETRFASASTPISRPGATHVCILPIRVDNESLPDPRVIEAFAPKA